MTIKQLNDLHTQVKENDFEYKIGDEYCEYDYGTYEYIQDDLSGLEKQDLTKYNFTKRKTTYGGYVYTIRSIDDNYLVLRVKIDG